MEKFRPEETIADRLAIGTKQLDLTGEMIRAKGLEGTDLKALADYLYELAEHASGLAELAGRLIDRSGPNSAVRANCAAMDVELYFTHAENLFGAAQTMAAEALDRLRQMDLSEADGG